KAGGDDPLFSDFQIEMQRVATDRIGSLAVRRRIGHCADVARVVEMFENLWIVHCGNAECGMQNTECCGAGAALICALNSACRLLHSALSVTTCAAFRPV